MHKNQEAGSERGREMIETETSEREKVKRVERKKKKKKRLIGFNRSLRTVEVFEREHR